jgi:exo-1,4-beta-D-glucosaminidase
VTRFDEHRPGELDGTRRAPHRELSRAALASTVYGGEAAGDIGHGRTSVIGKAWGRIFWLALFFAAGSCGGNQQLRERAATSSVAPVAASPEAGPPGVPAGTSSLHEGWALQTSEKVTAGGEAVSQPGFSTASWVPAEVPTTVLGALVHAGVYKDPFFGKNLSVIRPEPFKTSWWYRKEFAAEAPAPGEYAALRFDGINYRANVWLNGKKIADKATLFGVWRIFEVDVTSVLRTGANALAVEVFPPQPGDFTVGFVDWNPRPADENMGLYRAVELRRSGAVSLEDVFVRSKVDLSTLKEASLTVSAQIVNHGERPAAGTVSGEIGDIRFEAPYALGPHEKKALSLTPAEVPALRIVNPRLWWPVNLGAPELYELKLTALVDGRTSDASSVHFGIRDVGEYATDQGHRGFTVNGKRVLVRGGGWVDDLFLREDEKKLDAQLEYARHMNLNTIRLEGFWGSSQRLYDLADRKGLLVMTGFSCHWEWEQYIGKRMESETYGGAKSPEEIDLLASYLSTQVHSLRNHPSVLVWMVGSDKLPWPDAEKRYRDVLREADPTRPYLASAKGWTSEVSGPTRVKMLGPYNYVTPNYWSEDKIHGGAFGFNTETGPGPQVPPLASLKKMLPDDKLWPINDVWNFHCAEREYADLSLFLNAFEHRYGKVKNIGEFAFKAQASNYEAMRAMFDAFGAAKPASTGVIQWMLNAGWPKLYWQLFDYYLMPNGAFYGARKASQPENLVYTPADRSVYLVNDTLADLRDRKVEISLLDVDSKPVFETHLDASVGPNASRKLLKLPALGPKSGVYFLDLMLTASDGKWISDNFYWLSSKPDVLKESEDDWDYTPNKAFADFRALGSLPVAKVEVRSTCQSGVCEARLTNTSDHVAFFLELQVNKGATKEPVLPVFWSDNYVSLLPHESRALRATFAEADLAGAAATVSVMGWNAEFAN